MAVTFAQQLPQEGGLLTIDKPAEWTSHDVVARFRSLLKIRQIGHTGTLDPMATGVLVLCVGAATKMARFLVGLEKEYLGTMHLGASSDTLDAEGRISTRVERIGSSREEIEEVFRRFTGRLQQIPPMYSAVKHRGQPLHRLARKGQTVERPPRTVIIRSLRLLRYQPPQVTFRVVCTSGTYVRVLAADIGDELGTGAYLESLRRERVGPFGTEQALTVDQAIERNRDGTLIGSLQPVTRGLQRFPRLIVHPRAVDAVRHGRPLTPGMVRESDPAAVSGSTVRVEDETERLLAMMQVKVSADRWDQAGAEESIGSYLRVLN